MTENQRSLQLVVTSDHDCSYLPDQQSRLQFIAPDIVIDTALYSLLIRHGFRRSGSQVYRPGCQSCQQCLSLRLPVEDFKMTRSQRRCWRQLKQLDVIEQKSTFKSEHFKLYQRYMQHRHADSAMAETSEESYSEFLSSKTINTHFVEFHHHGQLQMIAVTDCLQDGLSSVYTFFDPDSRLKSLGTLGILWQIHAAQARQLPYLYLGYYIAECDKMNYKAAFRPVEALIDHEWRYFDKGQLIE